MSEAAKRLPTDKLVERLDELPTLPTVVHELSRLINDPMSSTGDIEEVMEKDQSITAKVLKLINSAYYAIPGGVSSLSRAIAYLGFDTVNQLILSTSIVKALQVKGPQAFDVNSFWTHSIGTGIAAETIAKRVKHNSPSDLFTCGLVHDIGKLALLVLEPDLLMQISQKAKNETLTFEESERELQTSPHTHIGFLLAKKWNLPLHIQNAIQHHHQIDNQRRGGISVEQNLIVDITILANLLIHALKFGNSGYDKIPGAPKEVLKRLMIDLEGLKEISREIKSNLDKAEGFMKIIREG